MDPIHGFIGTTNISHNTNLMIAAAAVTTSSSSSSSSSGGSATTQLSRYENQKRRDWNTFGQYLRNHRPPLSLSRCGGAHVLEFLRYLDQFGKTKVYIDNIFMYVYVCISHIKVLFAIVFIYWRHRSQLWNPMCLNWVSLTYKTFVLLFNWILVDIWRYYYHHRQLFFNRIINLICFNGYCYKQIIAIYIYGVF